MRTQINTVILSKINSTGRIPQTDLQYVEDHNLLLEDFALDSLDVMEVIIECEGIFGKTVPNERLAIIKTKEDIYRLFEDDDERR